MAPDERDSLDFNWFGQHEWMRRGREDFRPVTAMKLIAATVLGLVVLLVGFSLVLSAGIFLDGSAAEQELAAGDLAVGSLVNIVIFTGPPLLWVAAFYADGWRAWGHRLLLRSDAPFRDFGLGILGGIALVVIGLIASLLIGLAGGPTENPVVEALGAELTWPLILIISISAGVSEEVFFRGFLQGRIGIVATNVLFGLVHLDYGTPIQVFLPMLLGFVFSWMVLRWRSLWPAIIAHAVFDVIMLALTMYAAREGWTAALV